MTISNSYFSRLIPPILRLASVSVLALCALWTGGQAPSIRSNAAVRATLPLALRGQKAVDNFKQQGLHASPAGAARYKAGAAGRLSNPSRNLRASLAGATASAALQTPTS